MEITIHKTKEESGREAAVWIAASIKEAITSKGAAAIILATGASQFDMLTRLTAEPIQWSKVTAFHLDEYIGLPETHPASFRKYLKERFEKKISPLKAFHYVNGDADDPEAECRRLGGLIRHTAIDIACIGIGENGHLAFNDPPADFTTAEPYLVVDLDEGCRNQQYGEGWFPTFEDVPGRAISMSIKQIMKSAKIACTVPDERKADAVRKAVEGEVTNTVPASILQTHPDCTLFLDQAAASHLNKGK